MSYEKFRLTDDAISTNGVEAAPDKLTGTTQENKKVFDRLIRAVVKDIINGLAEQIGTDVARFDSGEGKISAETAAALELNEGATLNDALVRLKNIAASGGIPTAEFVAVSKATAEAYGLEGDVTVDMVLQVIVDAITEAAAKSYTKAETLSPTTKVALGLGEDAVPDDAFASLGYHTWRRRTETTEVEYVESLEDTANETFKNASPGTTETIYYSDRYTFANGIFSLVNPKSVTFSYSNTSGVEQANGHYLIFNSAENEIVYYTDKIGTTTFGGTADNYNVQVSGLRKVVLTEREYTAFGEYEYVTSPNRHAYPDSGKQGIFTYEYLGAPLENAKEAYGMRLHWWKRRTEESGYALKQSVANTVSIFIGSGTYQEVVKRSKAIYYGDSIVLLDNGNIQIQNPQTTTIQYNTGSGTAHSNLSLVIGKYFSLESSATTNDGAKTVYFGSDDIYTSSKLRQEMTSDGMGISAYVDIFNQTQFTTEYHENNGEYEYLSSPNRNAYPDSGKEGIFSYQYLAVPFENAREAAKIVTGSYVGTGTYGTSNPCSLTFGFVPKIVIFYAGTAVNLNNSASVANAIINWGITTKLRFGGTASSNANELSYNGDTLRWYNTNNANYQMNNSGTTYYYTAIG